MYAVTFFNVHHFIRNNLLLPLKQRDKKLLSESIKIKVNATRINHRNVLLNIN